MKNLAVLPFLFLSICLNAQSTKSINPKKFNIKKDFLLVPFDCKPDVDDLHTIAAFSMLLDNKKFCKLKYHAVAGAYGIQKKAYVPANDLFQLAFKNNWTDIHNNDSDENLKEVQIYIKKAVAKNGDIWIAEAGQSDFSAKIVKYIQSTYAINTQKRVHIVQHSLWNEKVSSPKSLQFVKDNTDYYKIPDGNKVENGTPGFKSTTYKTWLNKVNNQKLKNIWALATQICERYNGKDERYYNKAIGTGGVDFSDLVEVLWILNIDDTPNSQAFFNKYGK